MLGRGLDRQVQGGLHHQILLRLADHLAHLGVDPVDEVLPAGGRQHRGDAHRLTEGVIALGGCDGVGLHHLVEHDGGAPLRPSLVGDGAVARRGLQHAGQQGRLAQAQLGSGLVEIALRGRLDAIGAGAEIDPVEIQGEDLLLGELGLEPYRQHQLLGLAVHVLRRGQE